MSMINWVSYYGETSINGHSEMRTTSIQRTQAAVISISISSLRDTGNLSSILRTTDLDSRHVPKHYLWSGEPTPFLQCVCVCKRVGGSKDVCNHNQGRGR